MESHISWLKGICLSVVSVAANIDHCHLNEQQQQSKMKKKKRNYILPLREIDLIWLAGEHHRESERLLRTL
jgi:hypothetical protein